MTEFFAALIGALVGGIASWVGARFEGRRQTRLQQARSLFRVWQETDMLRARVRADRTLEDVPGLSFREVHRHLGAEQRWDDWEAVSMVIHYFDEAGLLVRLGEVDARLLRGILGGYTKYWWDRHLSSIAEASAARDDEIDQRWTVGVRTCVSEFVA